MITAIAVVAVGLVVGIIVFNSSAPKLGRGAARQSTRRARSSPRSTTATRRAPQAIACDSFVNPAKAAARTGSDPGISFALGRLTTVSNTAAHVSVQERIELPGGLMHTQLADAEHRALEWPLAGLRPVRLTSGRDLNELRRAASDPDEAMLLRRRTGDNATELACLDTTWPDAGLRPGQAGRRDGT